MMSLVYLNVFVKLLVLVKKMLHHGFSKNFQNTLGKTKCLELYQTLHTLVILTGNCPSDY